MWYVYVIQSQKQAFLYVGSTNNLDRRIQEHNQGLNLATAPYKPYKVLVSICFSEEHRARTLEKYFKTGSGRTILKKRILNNEDLAQYEVRSEA